MDVRVAQVAMEPRRLAATALALLALAGGPTACGTTDEDSNTDTESEQTTPQPADAEQPLNASLENGREIFTDRCGSCHTLDAAGTTGQVGPNLDEAQVDREDVLRAIETGGTGSGTMPADLVSGKDAQDVAAFVSESGPGAP